MRVSVVIPAYNAGLLLYRSVRSALEQTRAPHEIIVVDDASTDGSIATITRYFPQVRIVSNGINRGAAESRNEGARQATGTAIAFLDADDSWMPEKLERQSAAMTASGAALCLSGFDDLRARRIRWGTRDAQGDFVELLEAGLPLNTSTLMIDRAALLASGAFDGTLRRGEDVEFYYRMALRGIRACFVGAPLARYHHDNEDSLTSAPTEILRFSVLKDRLNATEASPEHRARVMRVLTRHWATRALSAVAKGRRDPAFERDLLQHGAPEALRALRAVVAVAPVLGRAGAAAPLALARSRQQRGRMP